MNSDAQTTHYDVFLSHNSTEKPIVRELGEELKKRGLHVWLDEWNLVPGRPWQEALEEIIEKTKSAAVLIGRDNLGPWQRQEMRACISQLVQRDLPVIPVLLPGAGAEPKLPLFLEQCTFVDMRDGITPKALDRLQWGITNRKPNEQTSGPVPTRVSIARLPRWDSELIGREDEIEQLDQAWLDPEINISSIVAFGGVGKSALVYDWLLRMKADEWREAKIVYGYSFYHQGAHKKAQTSADSFLVSALDFFGDHNPNLGSSWEKGERLARMIRKQSTLLILDGIEPMQLPRSSGMAGQISDPGLLALLRELADSNNGLCVVTTREELKEVGAEGSNLQKILLSEFSSDQGATLLKQIGVKGTDEQLQQASDAVSGHGLALTLLGKYLVKAHGGDVRKRNVVQFSKADQRQGGSAKKIMAQYEEDLGEGPELCILRLLGLFDRPASGGELARLRSIKIPGLTDAIHELSEDDWDWAVANLRECGLVAPEKFADSLDAHPLVREHFADQLGKQHVVAAREGHKCLYEYLKETAKPLPKTLSEMRPLFHAVSHGCKAGLATKVATEVYLPRILRDQNRPFSVFQLGAVGADLTANASFYESLWNKPLESLIKPLHGPLFIMSALNLRASNRLEEAEMAARRAVEATLEQNDFKFALKAAVNLGDLLILKGNLGSAVAEFERAIDLADQIGDKFWKSRVRAGLGHVLHLSGKNQESHLAFEDAESIRAQQDSKCPHLYGLQGYRYCELKLDDIEDNSGDSNSGSVHFEELQSVRDRVNSTSSYGKTNDVSVLDSALSELIIAKSWLIQHKIAGDSQSDCLEKASTHLHGEAGALSLLRKSGRRDYLPAGLLACGALARMQYLQTSESSYLQEAERRLKRTEIIARDGPLLIWQIEAAIEATKLNLAKSDKTQASNHIKNAKSLIDSSEDQYSTNDWKWASPRPNCVGALKENDCVKFQRRDAMIQSLERSLD